MKMEENFRWRFVKHSIAEYVKKWSERWVWDELIDWRVGEAETA